MDVLVYKGIPFDEWTKNEDGTYWAEICSSCAQKYWELIQAEVDDGITAIGMCSIEGCCANGMDSELHYYIDFNNAFIEFRGES